MSFSGLMELLFSIPTGMLGNLMTGETTRIAPMSDNIMMDAGMTRGV